MKITLIFYLHIFGALEHLGLSAQQCVLHLTLLDVSLNSQVYLQRIEGQHQLNQCSIDELICFSSHANY